MGFLNGNTIHFCPILEDLFVMEKRRLGRGLDALIGTSENGGTALAEQSRVAIERIQHNPYQPRKAFDAEELAALGESIRTHGILQPLVVRPLGDRYQLVAGERRLRAAQAVGVTDVPVRVVDFNDQQVLEAALVENIQRADLNPIEKAQGFKDYLDRFRMTQEQLAQRLGLDRTTISNLVNLLDLPHQVQEAVRLGQITLGHAKVLKGVADRDRQVALCKEIIARGHSVRATEALLKPQKPEPAATSNHRQLPDKTAHVQSIEDQLRQKLCTRVEIRLKERDKGQIVLTFDSNDDFERILEVLNK
jgi:ParB family chromosome partitioning protein